MKDSVARKEIEQWEAPDEKNAGYSIIIQNSFCFLQDIIIDYFACYKLPLIKAIDITQQQFDMSGRS